MRLRRTRLVECFTVHYSWGLREGLPLGNEYVRARGPASGFVVYPALRHLQLWPPVKLYPVVTRHGELKDFCEEWSRCPQQRQDNEDGRSFHFWTFLWYLMRRAIKRIVEV